MKLLRGKPTFPCCSGSPASSVLAHFDGSYHNAAPALIANDKARYLATLSCTNLPAAIIADTLNWAGVQTMPDLGDLHLARRGELHFAVNFGQVIAEVPDAQTSTFLVGARRLAPVGVAIWTEG